MPLRELLLIAISIGLVVASFARPFWGLCGWFWFSVMRPDALAWSEGKYPIAKVLGAVVLVTSLPRVFSNLVVKLRNPWLWVFAAYMVPIVLAGFFTVGPMLSEDRFGAFLRLALMASLIPLAIETVDELKIFLAVIAGAMGFVGAKFGAWSLMHGGATFLTGYSRQYDNNTLGLAFAIATPLCWYTASLLRHHYFKLGFVAMSCLSGMAAVMTTSRGAALSLIAAVVYIMLRSRQKLAVMFLILIGMGPGIYLVQEELMARVRSAGAEASALSRIELGRIAIEVWKDHPVLGVGFGSRNFTALASSYANREIVHNAHNSWLQTFVDSGTIAGILFLVLVFGQIAWLSFSIRRIKRLRPELLPVPYMLQAGLIAYAIDATFHSFHRMELAYVMLLSTAAWYRFAKETAAEPAPAAAPETIAAPSPVIGIAGRAETPAFSSRAGLSEAPKPARRLPAVGIATRLRTAFRSSPNSPR